jgi:hypothetical protein
MKAQHTNQNEEAFSRVLREWKIKNPLPPRFEESVWHRIQRSEAQGPAWKEWFSRLASALTRPALGTSYLAVLLLAGLLAGYWQARAANAQAEARLSARYVQVIDPYQMPPH